MTNPITVGYNPVSKRIFAGRSKSINENGGRMFVGETFDVTDDALDAVTEKLEKEGKSVIWELADGSTATLAVTVKPREE